MNHVCKRLDEGALVYGLALGYQVLGLLQERRGLGLGGNLGRLGRRLLGVLADELGA